ncbi:putative triacylglycerol lipase precursor [Pseudomassariella vexata]|uniref:Putative triacylglycerol lipase n=1 Tax=Pseudomassariella vexata TaxID=1141098 RepID=A0A1Y2EJJ3_9PEZI|nr:putative triacylglycerol lipase precursor [Pseudomassariella vexata]ORY71721.1 putative triacylglycerol lipase precursor [Pseudomassariella vexata]
MKPFTWTCITSFALLAVANPIPDSLRLYLNNRAAAVTESEVQTLDYYAQYAAAAYCNSDAAVGSVVTCGNSTCDDVTASGATIFATLTSAEFTDAQGFVAVDPVKEVIVLSLRGSASVRNWITDFIFTQKACDLVSGCLVHTGFSVAYAEIKETLAAAIAAATAANPSYGIVFTGHSLGAAVSTLAAAYLRDAGYAIDIYAYGSPRVGNLAFVEYVTVQAGAENRITHYDDPVPRLPPIVLNYRHTSSELWLSTGQATTDDYSAADIKVCEGYANVACNGGTLGFDTDAHGHYLVPITACGPSGTVWKRETDEEMEAKVNEYVAKDKAYVKTLPNVWS